ncbi:MAG: lipase family protein [Candidatus Riflebacteria bacterium]|nr:lipase family protein [Candidatus Riflebacteria bacterium]
MQKTLSIVICLTLLFQICTIPVTAKDRTAQNTALAKIVTEDLIPLQVKESGLYKVNFELILNYAVLCQMMNYHPDEDILDVYPNTKFIDLPKFKNRMMIIDDAGRDERGLGIQTVVFRGSGHPRNFLVDLNFRPSKAKELDCRIHRGFLKSVREINLTATKLLDKNRKVRLAGSSLGGGLAVVYAMFLKKQGFDVDQIITFGQPRVTDEKGRNLFNSLPLVRVVNRTDAFPAIPPHQPFGYSHFGTQILLYDEDEYSIYDQYVLEKIRPTSKVANFIYKVSNKDISIPNHFINLVASRLEGYVKKGVMYRLFDQGILPEDKQ